MYGIDGRAELPERTLDHLSGYENARPGARRQRGALAGPARRLGRGARLGLPAHEVARRAARARLADADPAGRGGGGELAQARPRHLGGARRAEALHVLQAHVLGGAGPRRAARGAARGLGARGAPGARPRTRSTPTSARTRSTSRGVFTQHYETEALDASVLLMPLVRFLPADDPRIRATVLAIADELTEDGLVLRYRVERDRRRALRRGGRVHDLLVLARLGAVRDRRDRARARACARSCSPTRAPSGSTPRRSTPARAATSATSRRRSRTSR